MINLLTSATERAALVQELSALSVVIYSLTEAAKTQLGISVIDREKAQQNSAAFITLAVHASLELEKTLHDFQALRVMQEMDKENEPHA